MGWRGHHGSGKRRKGEIARVCRGLRAGQRRVGHSATSKYPDPESGKTFVKDPDGYLTISEEGIKRYFAADLSPEEQAIVAATQGPFHVRTLTAPVSQAAWREKPTFMVVATKDAIIPPQMERDQVKAAKATAIEVPSSHVALLSFPKEVAELIIKAAE